MITGARQLPIQHLSIRVPWHDNGWQGTVCEKPGSNTSCCSLARIAEEKDDSAETEVAGCAFADLQENQLPPCVEERAGFMCSTPLNLTKRHPYASSEGSHRHFVPTPYTTPAYSAACVPFRWMLKKESPEIAAQLQLGLQQEREPTLSFETDWLQDRTNQLVMLDTFFSAIKPDESLCFFYAKDTPLSSTNARVILGVGLVRSVAEHIEYQYSTQRPPLRSVLWERNVGHSIRPSFEDGFLFPYAGLLDLAMERGLDPEEFVAFAPDETFWSYSYTSEHVSHDQAIASVLSCLTALDRIELAIDGPWHRARAWLDAQLNRLWRLRGPFPGFGSALTAFLGQGGTLVAYDLARQVSKDQDSPNVDPWPAFDRLMRNPDLVEGASKHVLGEGFARAWAAADIERKSLLRLLSRFSLSADQAKRFWNRNLRPEAASDRDILSNPYLIYELDRFSEEPVTVQTIDRGMLPDAVVLEQHPLPTESSLEDKVDPRRVRALMVASLEAAAERGHTLLPQAWITRAIDGMELDTDCPAGPEVLTGLDDLLEDVVSVIELTDDETGYQLKRLADAKTLISQTVRKRVGPKSRRHIGTHEWRAVVDHSLGKMPKEERDQEAEERARSEKAAALEVLFSSRLSVLIGAAGTGKTTLLEMLCSLADVKKDGILLLAPTGKARVQLEKRTGRSGGMTVAQLLAKFGGRYNGESGRYVANGHPDRCADYSTVIVDECSMLTEEQLAALIDGISGVDRLVLVGDPRQLPPIGTGRPFVDITRHLRPADVETAFPRIGQGYAELTIPRRQRGETRADLLLASWFGGSPDPAADEIWDRLESNDTPELRSVTWKNEADLEKALLELIVEELKLAGPDDELGFALSLGAVDYEGTPFYWRTRSVEAPPKGERWQVISPIRGSEPGVENLNRLLQRTFRRAWLRTAQNRKAWAKINPPQGRQGIIYGDKVINLENSGRRRVYPDRDESYVANGDVGIVVGAYRTRNSKKLFRQLQVEFTSQPRFSYNFWLSEFSDDASSPLELAYALTVHKTQGSEFGTTFVVLPNPCWLLSRELLYTALTRQQDRIVILHQGDVRQLRSYSSDEYAETVQRLTNLFETPTPVAFPVDGQERFLEEGLIHRTKRGDLVRSKAEVIIANELLAQGIDRYEYEAPVRLADGTTRYPDFTVTDDDTGEVFYWEHLGLLHDPTYRARWERKLAAYRGAGILTNEDGGGPSGTLIITRDDEVGGIDAQAIATLIADVLVS